MEKRGFNLLLMTWTVSPNNWILNQGYSKTIKAEERLIQYISTILYYLSIWNIDGIVFIDNSNYSIDEKILKSIEEAAYFLWKEIEFLPFQWNTENQLKYTYWYWEFETLEHMQKKSSLYKKADWIYKVTGRYKIYNISELIEKSEALDNLFYKYNIFNFSWLNTVFFKISKQNIEKTIINYESTFREGLDSKIRLWWEEILFTILADTCLTSIRVYPYFFTIGFFKYWFYQSLTLIGFFDTTSILYKVLRRISLLIPLFVKLKFNKLLKFILSWLKR